MKKMKITELKRRWLNEYYSYSPKRFISKESIELLSADYPFKRNIIDIDFENLIILKIVNGLRELEWVVNKSDNRNNELLRFLERVAELDIFYILLFEDDKFIDKCIKINNNIDLVSNIYNALNWDNPQNILLYKK